MIITKQMSWTQCKVLPEAYDKSAIEKDAILQRIDDITLWEVNKYQKIISFLQIKTKTAAKLDNFNLNIVLTACTTTASSLMNCGLFLSLYSSTNGSSKVAPRTTTGEGVSVVVVVVAPVVVDPSNCCCTITWMEED